MSFSSNKRSRTIHSLIVLAIHSLITHCLYGHDWLTISVQFAATSAVLDEVLTTPNPNPNDEVLTISAYYRLAHYSLTIHSGEYDAD